MADTVVDAFASNDVELSGGTWGPYWTSDQIGAMAFLSASGYSVRRTTDGGSNWTEHVVDGSASVVHCAAWYDQETPGVVGTILHLAWLDGQGGVGTHELYYRDFDISDGTYGSPKVEIIGSLNTGAAEQTNKVGITKTRSGNLIAAYRTQDEDGVERSTDGGATWAARTTVFEAGENDFVLLFPADTGDDDDAACLFLDQTGNQLSIKIYDESANSWPNELNVFICPHTTGLRRSYDGSVRHSDGHILVSGWDLENNANADLQTADVTPTQPPSVTVETEILTDQGGSGGCPGIWINQQTNEVRVVYLKGTDFFGNNIEVFYQVSTDDLTSWDGEVVMSEDGVDDLRSTHAGRTVGDSGGRFQPSWFNDDLNDVLINETNDEVIAAVAGGPAPLAKGGIIETTIIRTPGRMVPS